MGRFIDIHAGESKAEKEVRRRVGEAMSPNPSRRAKVSAVTGQTRRCDSGLSMWRTQMQGTMISMYLDPKNGMDCGAISRHVNEEASRRGYDFVVTPSMVQTDIKKGLAGEIERHKGDMDSVWSGAASALREVIRSSMEDYEKSKSVDAKSEASMLRTLIKDAGMSYEEAMVEIQAKRYAGNPDHMRVMMEALERYAGMYGLSIKAASVALQQNSGGQQNQSGNIVNYNFGDADREKMKDIVKMLQDSKFASMREDAPSSPSQQPVDEQEVADE